jgi:hypothetical protein
MRDATGTAEESLNLDDSGGKMGRLARIAAMSMAFGVVAIRAGDYLSPRMCGGCF